MAFNLVTILTLITGTILIALILLVYVRSRQGDQRVINTTNQMLLPLLSAIVITLGIVFANHRPTSVCTGLLLWIRYAVGSLLVLLTFIGAIRYLSSQSHDRRLIMHPILFAIIVAIMAFLVEYLKGCL
jgi:cytochrome bd-type quinol oxidase subunit 2